MGPRVTAAICERCGRTLVVGDRVVDVREVTRVRDGSISTDRGDAVAHVQCPTDERTQQ